MGSFGDFFQRGLGPAPIGSPGGGLSVAWPIESFETPSLDLTVVQSNIELVPARPGYIALGFAALWLIEAISGTQTSPPTLQAGSDAAHSNFIPSTNSLPSNANINGGTTLPFLASSGSFIIISSPTTTTLQRLPNTTTFLDITAGAAGTGDFALRGRLIVGVKWCSARSSS